MTTFYTNSFYNFSTRLFLVALFCCSYVLLKAQCNPDTTPPVAVCDAAILVSLSADGTATLFAETFDDGSFDNCCPVTLQVRRDNGTCPANPDDATFGNDVTFCCEDIDVSPIFVILEVADCNGNTNSCFAEVTVEDKLSPVAICPADTVITCGFWTEFLEPAQQNSGQDFQNALAQYIGEATFFDNCGPLTTNLNLNVSSFNCADFTISRTWTVADGNPTNTTASCTNILTIEYDSFWDVAFPTDTTVNDFGVSSPDFTGYPELVSGSCGVIAIAYEDIVINSSPNLCAKILRTWTVLNWCDGSVMTHNQVIDVSGGVSPIITCPDDLFVYTNSTANITLPLPTTPGGINNYTVSATSDLPNFNANTYSATDVPEGVYLATFTVVNICGDAASCSFQIEVAALGNTDCPQDTIISCDFFQNTLEAVLSQQGGDLQAQNEALNPFFGVPNFDNGTNVTSHVTIDVDACGQGTLTRVWELDDSPSGGSDCFHVYTPSNLTTTGNQVCVDVFVDGFEDILSFQYSMNFDETVLAFDEIIDPGNVPDLNFGTNDIDNGNIVVLWFDEEDAQGETFSDGTLLYQVCFNTIGNFGDSGSIGFSSNPTIIEVTNGDEESVCFEGTGNNILIGTNNPSSDCFIPAASTSTTSADVGDVVCFDVPTLDFDNILSFQYSINFDASILEFVSYQENSIISNISLNSDNSNNGTLAVSWFDIASVPQSYPDDAALYQLCFNVIGGQGQNAGLIFNGNPVPVEIIDGNLNNVCFEGISEEISINTPSNPQGCFTQTGSTQTATPGEQVCVDVTVTGFNDILSFQYSVNFDPTILAFNSINDPENIPDLNFGLFDVANGSITVLWFDEEDALGKTYPDGTLLYEVCFDVIGNIGDNADIDFSSNPTLIEITNGDEESVCFESFAGNIMIGNGQEPLVVNPSTILCTQIITIELNTDWDVIFPQDSTVNCSLGTVEAGEPVITNGGCGLFATTYEDQIFNNPDGTFTIIRTWTVINWCDGTTATSSQTITVNDINPPIFSDNCNLPNVCLENNSFSCVGGLTIPTPTVIDCANVDLTATSDFGDGFGPFTNVSSGSYQVTFTATDAGGNQAVCVANVNVTDCTPPVAICDVDVTVALSPDGNDGGTATIFTETLDDGSYDNCTTDLDFSFSVGTTLNSIDFDCSDVGTNIVQLFITDEYGNQNSCATEVSVTDALDLCPCSGLSNPPSLVCNNDVQVSLDLNGMAAFQFEYILEGVSPDCIADLDLSFSNTENIDVLNLDCSDIGSQTVVVYLTTDNGSTNTCWGNISVSDPLEACGDPTDCVNDVFVPDANCVDGLVVELLHINDPNNTSFESEIEVYAIDLNNGSTDNCPGGLTYSFSADTSETSIVFNCENIGENTLELWVTDAAGNQNFCETFVVVQANQGQCAGDDPICIDNTIAPIAICNNNIIASLDFSGQVVIWAETIDEGSYDDCTQDIILSFDEAGQEPNQTFTCNDLGDNVVTLYVTDENGNQNFCWTTLTIVDNLNACDDECINDTEAPEAYCVSGLVIQIPSSGMLTLSASLFNVGSIDNCTDDLNLEISTIDNAGNTISGPASGLPFNANNVGANNVVLTVTDAAGNSSECTTLLLLQSNPPKVITGKIFIDDNDDCTYNAGEQGLNTWGVKLEAIDDTLATNPGIVVLPPSFEIDSEGNYTITLPDDFVFFTLDSSTVSVNNLTPYLRVSLATAFNYGQNCDYNYFINSTTNVLDTVEIDFPVQILEDCPQLSVDISTPYLRRCFDNTYYVNYCNFGNIDETDAFLEIEFDSFLIINGSTLPWTSVDGNLYTFDIGIIAAAECGSFEIDFTVSCDAVLGQTHCTEAHIFPDQLCDPVPPQFSGASIEVMGQCDGDQVIFTITNVGDDDMNEPLNYIVIEDFIMYNTETFNLVAGGSTEIILPANGSTWRIEAEQEAFHPGNSTPAVAVEGCTTDGTFSTGFVTQFYQNDNDPFISINCQENIGSFDPNDKQASVIGYSDEHYIYQNTDIEYTIRFQNTGTDTAFNVIIMDTLDVNLDPLSVRPGVSSHPYDFTILGDNVLKFNFDNIELPDSNVNVVASQGFIKFRVSQNPDVALETIIENNAAIYFDFNEPIITNIVFHTIGDHFIEILDNTDEEVPTIGHIKIYPNPFDETATVEINGLDIQNGVFRVFDMQGRLVEDFNFSGNKFSVKADELPSGMYSYQLENEVGELMKTGKLMIQ